MQEKGSRLCNQAHPRSAGGWRGGSEPRASILLSNATPLKLLSSHAFSLKTLSPSHTRGGFQPNPHVASSVREEKGCDTHQLEEPTQFSNQDCTRQMERLSMCDTKIKRAACRIDTHEQTENSMSKRDFKNSNQYSQNFRKIVHSGEYILGSKLLLRHFKCDPPFYVPKIPINKQTRR